MSQKETKAERREAARQARIEAQRKRQTARRRKRNIIILAVVVAVVVGGYFLLQSRVRSGRVVTSAAQAAGCGDVEEHKDQGAQHIEVGTPHEEYNSNPPSSGPHYGSTADWGVHDETVTPELLVHNLEHGGVVVHYSPDDLSDSEIEDLEELVQGYPDAQGGSGVILNPNPEIEGAVAMASWQKTWTCERVDTVVVEAFISDHCEKGPEKVPLGC